MSLRSAFHFTSSDLEANRRGEITEKQRSQLLLRMYGTFVLILVVVLGVGGTTFCFFIDGLPLETSASPWLVSLLQWTLISALIVLVSFGVYRLLIAEYHSLRRKIDQAQVVLVRGYAYFKIQKIRTRTGYRYIYTLIIGPQRFDVTQEQLYAFTEGALYCVYYTPKPRSILSAEVAELQRKEPE